MRYSPIALATALLFTGAAANAAPTISGNKISWPDDGWYQVQLIDDDGITEICNGGRSCEVTSGQYIVINHTTGERFEDIVVTGEPVVDGVTVSGNTVSWPNDGWYQVQNADTFDSVCQGGRSCEVSNGTYFVINHSTGQRFENVVVSDDDRTGVVVSGNTILWPDDGYYQVQDANTFISICEGERSCEVEPGVYIVINHSTAERFENIEVGEDTTTGEGSTINISNYESVLTEVLFFANAEYSNETRQITQQFLDQNGFGERLESSDDFTFLRSDFAADPVAMMTTETQIFGCVLGGGFSAVVNTSSSSGTTSIGALNNCSIDDGIIDGEFASNGFSSAKYSGVTVNKDDHALRAVDISYSERRSNILQGRVWYFGLGDGIYSSDSDVVTTIESARLSLSESVADSTFSTELELSYSSPLTNEENVSLSTIVPFTTLSDGSEQYYSSGELRIEAADGSAIQVNADNGDNATFTATVTESGTTSTFVLLWSDSHRIRCFNAESREPLTRFFCN